MHIHFRKRGKTITQKFFYVIAFQFLLISKITGLTTSDEIVIKDYSYSDGLTTNSVNNTYRDSRGFLWICSINGLYRYDGYNFQKLTGTNNNLHTEILCIVEDENKNFWIGTAKNGLFFYNTYTEQTFKVALDLKTTLNINKILLFKNKIWLGTNNGLIIINKPTSFYNTAKINKIIIPEPLNLGDQKNKITYLYVPSDSVNVWIGTNGGTFVLNSTNYWLKGIISHPQNSVRVMVPFQNHILIGSWDGGVFLTNSQTFEKIENNPIIKWINNIIEYKRVISATYDDNKQLWIATYGDGLYCFDIENKNFKYFSCRQKNENYPQLNSDIINHIFYDHYSNILWVSMNQPALTKIYFEKNNFQTVELEKYLKNQSVEISCVSHSNKLKECIWVGTSHNGLFLYNTRNKNLQNFNTSGLSLIQLPSNNIAKLYEDRNGNLWIVFRRIGLYVIPSKTLEKLTNNIKIYPVDANQLIENVFVNSYIMSFYEDSKNRLWIGHWGSLHVLQFLPQFVESKNSSDLILFSKSMIIYKDDQPYKVTFPISPVQSIIEIKPNQYLIGTRDEGLIEVIEISDNNFVAQLEKNLNKKILGKNIQCFYMPNPDTLWIGLNTGLFLCNLKSGNCKYFNEATGLSSENINHIAADQLGNLWLSTSYGISHLKVRTNSIKNFLFNSNKNQLNFLINTANAKLPSGSICFSTNKSLIIFNPDDIYEPIYNLSLYFTNVKINDQLITPTVRIKRTCIIDNNINYAYEIKIPYNTTLQLEFAALDYVYSDQIKYKYRINYNNWIALHRNQRSVTFYNQNFGEYQLQLMALHPSGSYSTRNIKLVFLPPWWKTWWAYTIYISIILILFFSYRKVIIQNIRQKVKIEQVQFERIKLQELDKIKTNFVTNLAHELRTPLSLIINPLETIIKNKSLDTSLRVKIEITLKNSYRLMKLANELSDFAKIEKELIQPELKNYDIIAEVKQICLLFHSLAETMNIDLQFHSAYKSLIIGFDKGMLEKIMFNLLSNAFKYTPQEGSVIVEITQTTIQNTPYVKLTVINTGVGIPEDKIDKIFNRFYQIDQSKQGLGIGLSIVKSLVEMHKGIIKVRSIPNVETSFDIMLPVRTITEKTVNSFTVQNNLHFQNSLQTNDSEHFNKKNYKLLIVEDDNDILKYLVTEFSTFYKVYSASNGEEGFQVCQNVIPDVVITDAIMPKLDGFELCKKLRNDMTTSHIPIIILSAKSTIDQQIEGLNAGANIYLIKPFNIQVLKNQIDKLIQLKESIYQKFFKDLDLAPIDELNNKLDQQFIEKIIHYIEQNISNPNLSVDDLSNYICLSKVQLYRKIKAITGQTIIEFITTIRLKKAVRLIIERQYNFAEIAYETGFSSPSYFTKCFREHFQMTPSEFLENYVKQKFKQKKS